MIDYIRDRESMLAAVREEFVGPAPSGEALETSDHVMLESLEKSYGPYRSRDGEEILCWENPITRYGVGVLFPLEQAEANEAPTTDDETQDHEAETLATAPDELLDDKARTKVAAMQDKRSRQDDDPGEFDLASANARRPSSLGVSFLVELGSEDILHVSATGGRYRVVRVRVPGRHQDRRWFVRRTWSISASIRAADLLTLGRRRVDMTDIVGEGLEDLDVRIEGFTRPRGLKQSLVTVTLVNRTRGTQSADTASLFQCDLRVEVRAADLVAAAILPYPGPDFTRLDEEEQSLSLLYRRWQAFAIGHGCAAEWTVGSHGRAIQVRGNVLPVVETASITPDIADEAGEPIRVRMAALAGLLPGDDGSQSLARLLSAYEKWLGDTDNEAAGLDAALRSVAARHIDLGRRALGRMRAGVDILAKDEQVRKAFRLANEAVLLQQLHSERESRRIVGRKTGGGYEFSRARADHDPTAPTEERGYWRAFQIAFLLMVLESASNLQSPDRDLVELIWFPTGGGKTEAYLGLTAFMIFLRRLRDPDDAGVEVLTRYTLRLLTTQQFQRAAALICAMEELRRGDERELGGTPFSIGIWLGSATTPNRRAAALKSLKDLQTRDDAENPFLVTQCPWCAAQIGPLDPAARKTATRIAGYSQRGTTVAINCPDSACSFANGLPVYVIDEDMYEERPSLLIGTVDKFAQLAWVPQARSLFGFDSDGRRTTSPPGLIIQDELHLISGPLGSLVGLYELAINELCTDRRAGARVPKVVTSTATIRRYQQQLLALYARPRAALFPPPGTDISDSFFSRYAKRPDGSPAPGRWYVGVHATNHRSLITTQVQSMAALLQAPMTLSREAADPWWTLMVFFNNLRELGTSLSLLQANIPMHVKAIGTRKGIKATQLRRILNPLELTSRIQNDEVPKVMAALDVKATSTRPWPVDVCLASNIIEVGIDIERLSLMLVVGQPKSTSQYIQVTGRVGRRWWDRPGLVVTLLNPARPRDRSHYEQFKAYHERLYAQVEPTSVTPFSSPAVERALHAVLASVLRQTGDRGSTERPTDVKPAALERFRELLMERVAAVDPDETQGVLQVFTRRADQLQRWRRPRWGAYGDRDMDNVMLSAPHSELLRALTLFSWPTPLSMRNVDAECELEITSKYLLDESPRP